MYENNDDFIPLQVPENTENDQGGDPFQEEEKPSSQSLPTMRNVKDLVNTLARMNKRLVLLEEENAKLREEVNSKAAKREVVKMIANTEALNPAKHGLTSDSFIVRAISIYGHWFVVNLVISLIMGIISFILFASMLNEIATNILNSGM
ncbi:MAG: hypothetical protein V2J07_12330 [Anaerolineae bacterium]|jgi:hypothetical protein|nr:hypothetical protein [Anaerolineae bacterium]